jgi:hypothetical protein
MAPPRKVAHGPLGVWLCLRGSDLDPREKAFVAWPRPRGVVAAAFASIVASSLDAHDVARWNVRLRHGLALSLRLRFSGRAGEAPRAEAGARTRT